MIPGYPHVLQLKGVHGHLTDFQQFLQLKAIEGYPQHGTNRYTKSREAQNAPLSLTLIANKLGWGERKVKMAQWAAVANEAIDIMNELEKQAKERMLAGKKIEQKDNISTEVNPGKLISQGKEVRTADKAAELFNTNPQYIKEAKKIKQEDPEAFEAIKAGENPI